MSAPTHAALVSPLARPLRYPLHLRVYDGFLTGRRDADTALAHEPVDGAQPSASLRRLDAALIERCEHELWDATAQAAVLLDRRGELERLAGVVADQVAVLTALVDASAQPTEAELSRVAATEAHLPPAQVRERRRREAAQRIAPLRSRLASHTARADALAEEVARLDGTLTTLFDGLTARVRALANLYERRAQTLVRSYLRRTPVGDAHRHPLNARTPLRPPAWASAPNPWLSSAAERAAASPTPVPSLGPVSAA